MTADKTTADSIDSAAYVNAYARPLGAARGELSAVIDWEGPAFAGLRVVVNGSERDPARFAWRLSTAYCRTDQGVARPHPDSERIVAALDVRLREMGAEVRFDLEESGW